jgi:uncharacterized membrane protein
MKAVLIVSLALNVLVFGAVAGTWLRGGPPGFGGYRGGPNIIGYVGSLPAERREVIFTRMKDLREQARALRQTTRQAQRERNAALLAEPFEKQRYVDAQTRQIESEAKLRLLMRDLVAEAAASLSIEERKAFARWRDGRRGGVDDSDPDPPPGKRK